MKGKIQLSENTWLPRKSKPVIQKALRQLKGLSLKKAKVTWLAETRFPAFLAKESRIPTLRPMINRNRLMDGRPVREILQIWQSSLLNEQPGTDAALYQYDRSGGQGIFCIPQQPCAGFTYNQPGKGRNFSALTPNNE